MRLCGCVCVGGGGGRVCSCACVCVSGLTLDDLHVLPDLGDASSQLHTADDLDPNHRPGNRGGLLQERKPAHSLQH